MKAWIGLALLAGSWMFGQGFYYPALVPVWLAMLAGGVWLLAASTPHVRFCEAGWGASVVCLALVLPAALVLPWPAKAGAICLAAAIVVPRLGIPRAWPDRLAAGLLQASAVLLVQAAAIGFYAAATSRSHLLPAPLVAGLAWVLQLVGLEASSHASELAIHTMRQVHRLAATWDLLLDPATFAFLLGGMILLGLRATVTGLGWNAWLTHARRLAIAVAAWSVLRAAVLLAVFIQRELRSDYDSPLHALNHVFAPWVLASLLAPLAVVCRRFVPLEGPAAGGPQPAGLTGREARLSAALVFAAAFLATMAVCFSPVGSPRAGRVTVVEKHSPWEPTTRPYDTLWYGEPSGYNYAAIYDYASRHFEMSRLLEAEPIDDARLAACDVLLVKTPTARFSPEEVAAIARFVERGGGLLLMGEHTNFDRSSSYLNDIARNFGFVFRHDLLFGMERAYEQAYRPAAVPHPAVRHVEELDFAVSCSIDPGNSSGRAAIRSTGLWNLPPNYNMANFFPVPEQRPEMQFGAFVQLWTTRHGQGRVAAFTDSTIFSNFSVFEPGKAELFLGIVDWLNRRSPFDRAGWVFWLASGASLAAAFVLRRPLPPALVLFVATGGVGLGMAAAAAMSTPPEPVAVRPIEQVVIDREVSVAALGKGGFAPAGGGGMAMVEQWIPRLGFFSARRSGAEAFSGQMLVVLSPGRAVSADYRQRLVSYVEAGGRLLVVDGPENERSTANSLLWPFGLALHRDRPASGPLVVGDTQAELTVEPACELSGGEPVCRIDGKAVAAFARAGKGAVLAVGFGSVFTDRNMGGSWNAEPDAAARSRYSLLFGLVEALRRSSPKVELKLIPASTYDPGDSAG